MAPHYKCHAPVKALVQGGLIVHRLAQHEQ